MGLRKVYMQRFCKHNRLQCGLGHSGILLRGLSTRSLCFAVDATSNYSRKEPVMDTHLEPQRKELISHVKDTIQIEIFLRLQTSHPHSIKTRSPK